MIWQSGDLQGKSSGQFFDSTLVILPMPPEIIDDSFYSLRYILSKVMHGGIIRQLRKEMHMANIYEQKAIDDLKTVAPEFAKLTQDFLFGDIWKRPGLAARQKLNYCHMPGCAGSYRASRYSS